MSSDKELAKWCKTLSEPSVATEEVPEGWLTTAQISAASGKERSTVSNSISLLLQRGKAEMRRFRILTNRGVYPVPHYRLK